MHQLHCLPPKLIKFSENPFVETWEFELSPDLGRIPLVSCTYLTLQSSPHRLTASTKRTVEVLKKRSQSQNANENQPNQTQDSLYFLSIFATAQWHNILELHNQFVQRVSYGIIIPNTCQLEKPSKIQSNLRQVS